MEGGVARLVENHCLRCGKLIVFLPFRVVHLLCKQCYGIESYRKQLLPKTDWETITSIPAVKVA